MADIFAFFSTIQAWISSASTTLSEVWYLAGWWAYFAVFVVVCILIRIFLPFKWLQACLGGSILLWLAFLAGLHAMANHFEKERQIAREKAKEAEADERPKDTGQGGWFRFPFP